MSPLVIILKRTPRGGWRQESEPLDQALAGFPVAGLHVQEVFSTFGATKLP